MRAFAWGGTLLFGGALTWFAFQYFVTFAVPVAGIPDAAAVGWNAALFTLFALHHSVFARTPLRHWVMRFGPALERPIYVWVSSLLFIAVCTLWTPVAGVAWEVEGISRWGLASLQVLGLVLTLKGAAVLDIRELSGLSAASSARRTATPPNPADPRGATQAPVFRTTWPYGWVRHPIYSGWFLLVWPVGIMTSTSLVFAILSSAYLLLAIPLEEATLRRTSGRAYADYTSRVRWRLLPGVY